MTIQKELGKPVRGKSTLVRPRFTVGLMLQDDDLTLAVDHIGNLSRLLFKSLFGCGVICGFEITPIKECGLKVTVHKGLALDCQGDPLQLPCEVKVVIEELTAPPLGTELWVAIKRKEYQCSPRAVVCAPDEEDQSTQAATRLRDGYEVQLFEKLSDCQCGCVTKKSAAQAPIAPYYTRDDACYADHYQGKCACDCCCEWVVLGRVFYAKDPQDNTKETWQVDYSARRFVRPMLARDPQVTK